MDNYYYPSLVLWMGYCTIYDIYPMQFPFIIYYLPFLYTKLLSFPLDSWSETYVKYLLVFFFFEAFVGQYIYLADPTIL